MPASPEKVARIIDDMSNFGRVLGLRITVADDDRVEAELEVTTALLNRNGMIHGGAIMAFADTLGGTGTFLNLADGEGTVTVESKTNFFRAVAEGQMLRAVCLPLHLFCLPKRGATAAWPCWESRWRWPSRWRAGPRWRSCCRGCSEAPGRPRGLGLRALP